MKKYLSSERKKHISKSSAFWRGAVVHRILKENKAYTEEETYKDLCDWHRQKFTSGKKWCPEKSFASVTLFSHKLKNINLPELGLRTNHP